MPLIVDAHQDLAWNMLTYGRDYTRSATETRQLEHGGAAPQHNGDALVGWPEYQKGQVALIFATLFVTPAHRRETHDVIWYTDAKSANRLYRQQIDIYRRLADSHPDKFQLVASRRELETLLAHWNTPATNDETSHPVGLVYLMEGAEGIRSPNELDEWWDLGLRLIGPAWAGTRFCGGTNEPGGLTAEGRELLDAMADQRFILDLSHMDAAAAYEAVDRYEAPLMASHANCGALMRGDDSNRHLPDRLIRAIVERGGVIGLIPFNTFLKPGWKRERSRREEVPLDVLIAHIDHVCQIAGDARHAGIGSDFDGGFGLQSVPPELDSVADLQKIAGKLLERGYSEQDAEQILGGNWLNFLREHLPA